MNSHALAAAPHTPHRRCADRRPLLELLAAAGLVGAGYTPVFSLYWREYWRSDALGGAYSHGALGLLVFGLLVWHNRSSLRAWGLGTDARVSGVALLTGGLILKVYGEWQHLTLLRGMSVVPLLLGVVRLRLPDEEYSPIRYAILFLLFVIPLPTLLLDEITEPLISSIATLITETLRWCGVEVERLGRTLLVRGLIPGETHEITVSPACSGLRSLVALLALTSLFLHLSRPDLHGQWWLLALVIPIAFATNLMRVALTVGLVITGHHEAAVEPFHEGVGMAAFLAAAALIMTLAKKVRRLTGSRKQT